MFNPLQKPMQPVKNNRVNGAKSHLYAYSTKNSHKKLGS